MPSSKRLWEVLPDLRIRPHPKKRNFGMVTAFLEELRVGELDPVSNKDVSHLARCFYYSAETVTPEVTEEADKLSLSQRYGQALRATQEVSFLGVTQGYP